MLQISAGSSQYSLAFLLTIVQGKPVTTAERFYFFGGNSLKELLQKDALLFQQLNLIVYKGNDGETAAPET